MSGSLAGAAQSATRNGHALVLGGSVAGMCAAQALAGFFERVTVVDRDLLPTDGTNRKAVPQGTQLHLLLARGAVDMDLLFPGLLADLRSCGVPVLSDFSTMHLDVAGHVQRRDASVGRPLYLPTRPFLESRLRSRMADNVAIRQETEVLGLVGDSGRVTGARVRSRGAAAELAADLVVDATGRGGRCVTWLRDLGVPAPPEEHLDVDIVYSAGTVRMPIPPGADQAFLLAATPRRPWGLGILRQEDDRWMVNAYGYAGHHPGGDQDSLMALARVATPTYWYRALQTAQWCGPVVTMHFPRTVRRRYDRHSGLPEGLLVMGDALCSFNPIYAQGMTVAAIEALRLRRCVVESLEGVGRRFHAATRRELDTVWRLGLGDLRYPGVTGSRPSYLGPLNRYVEAVQAAGARDPRVTRTFWRVAGLLDPPQHLFHPRVITAAARHGLRVRPAQPTAAP